MSDPIPPYLHLVYPLRQVAKFVGEGTFKEDDLKQLMLVTITPDLNVKVAVFPEKANVCRCGRFKLSADCEHIRPIRMFQKALSARITAPDDKLIPLIVKGDENVAWDGINLQRTATSVTNLKFDLKNLNNVATTAVSMSDVDLFRQLMTYSTRVRGVSKKWTILDIGEKDYLTLDQSIAALEVALAVTSNKRQLSEDHVKKSRFSKYSTGKLSKALASIPYPAEDEFYVSPNIWVQAMYCLTQGTNTLMTGPSGCGKTELVRLLAAASKRPFEAFNFGGMTEPRSSLIGNVEFTPEKGTFFSESRFVQAIQTPDTVVLLDEISRAPRDAFNILLPLLDGQRYLALDESQKNAVVEVAEGVTFWATANEGMEYTGTSILDRALRDRFQVLDLDFMPREKEAALLAKRCEIPTDIADHLAQVGYSQRIIAKKDMSFSILISTRSLIAAGNQFAFGIPLGEALEFCVESMFSDEGDQQSERTGIRLLITKEINGSDLVRTVVEGV